MREQLKRVLADLFIAWVGVNVIYLALMMTCLGIDHQARPWVLLWSMLGPINGLWFHRAYVVGPVIVAVAIGAVVAGFCVSDRSLRLTLFAAELLTWYMSGFFFLALLG